MCIKWCNAFYLAPISNKGSCRLSKAITLNLNSTTQLQTKKTATYSVDDEKLVQLHNELDGLSELANWLLHCWRPGLRCFGVCRKNSETSHRLSDCTVSLPRMTEKYNAITIFYVAWESTEWDERNSSGYFKFHALIAIIRQLALS